MKVELFFVPGCPNYKPAIERLRKVLAEDALDVQVHCIQINSDDAARAVLFPGSPTIRINGEDVEPGNHLPGLTCRLYSNRTGVPSEDVLRLAVARAKDTEEVR